jgi:exodeoxyribonuclease VII small subunit
LTRPGCLRYVAAHVSIARSVGTRNPMAKSDPTKISTAPVEAIAAPASFEAALAELEGIVATMEGGDLALEQSLAAYSRGAQLLKYCQAQLADAQQKVRILEDDTLKLFADNDHQR